MTLEETKRSILDLAEFIRLLYGMEAYKNVTPIFYYWMYHNLECITFEEYEQLRKDFK